MTPTILFATTNPGKLREARGVLEGCGLHVTCLDERSDWPEPIEDGDTFEANAKLKALHYARLAGGWTLAEDSGLEVDALGLEPGVYSARYAGPACDPAANNARLVEKLTGVPHDKRTGRFRCAVALAGPDGVVATAAGVVQGIILNEARGTGGFGYDPYFYVPEHGLTTAQMTPEQKNRISHRGRALRAIRPAIERLAKGTGGVTPGGE